MHAPHTISRSIFLEAAMHHQIAWSHVLRNATQQCRAVGPLGEVTDPRNVANAVNRQELRAIRVHKCQQAGGSNRAEGQAFTFHDALVAQTLRPKLLDSLSSGVSDA